SWDRGCRIKRCACSLRARNPRLSASGRKAEKSSGIETKRCKNSVEWRMRSEREGSRNQGGRRATEQDDSRSDRGPFAYPSRYGGRVCQDEQGRKGAHESRYFESTGSVPK